MVMVPFNPDNPDEWKLDRENVYLLGWQEHTPLNVTLDTISEQGLTLYVVQLEQ
jgi:hypothetical protein